MPNIFEFFTERNVVEWLKRQAQRPQQDDLLSIHTNVSIQPSSLSFCYFEIKQATQTVSKHGTNQTLHQNNEGKH